MAMLTNGFAKYLVSNNILGEFIVHEAEEKAKQLSLSLVGYLINNKLLGYKKIAEHTAKYFGLPQISLENYNINDTKDLIDKALIEKYNILPIMQKDNLLHIAITDPTQTQMLNEIKFYTNCSIRLLIAEYDKLNNIINNILYTHRYDDFHSEDAHIIKLVDQILHEAIEKNASDIHFEHYENNYRVRFRIDGILYEITNPDLALASRITARLKIMSRLNIAERRLPQDGRFTIASRDCRINICPTLFGEKIVVRILHPNSTILKINELGMLEHQQKLFADAIKRPQGMILVTGPTGSGKTVSLYAALNELNTINKNISTIEDPIEINLPGINQVNIDPRIGLTFAAALRAFLRQDPDIIMVGEIRDLETAEIAIKAAQTGHLVLSTLHTNSASETITRLLNMGIAEYNLNSSLSLIIAQRLARKLCPHCKTGCEHCHNGYLGRIGIFEVMQPQEPKTDTLTLHDAAQQKVREGLTSLEEINRIL